MNDTRQIYETQDEETIELRVLFGDLWRGFVKFWWVAVLLAILLGSIQFYRSYIRYTPVYRITATFTVHTENSVLNGDNGIGAYSFYYDRGTADQLAEVFPVVVSSSIVRQKVCADLGISSIPVNISASCITGSNLVTLTADGSDAQLTYDVLLSVMENYTAVADYIIGRTRIVTISEPELPEAPYNSAAWRTSVAKGVLLGLFAGFAWIVLYAILRKTVRTKEDIRSKLNQNCLGVLPQVIFKHYRRKINTDILITNPLIGNDFLESIRLLRSTVQSCTDEHGKVIMVTSTAPGEGKSVVGLNLAAMFAKNGSRVLIIDCDMRSSGVSSMTGSLEHTELESCAEYSIARCENLQFDILSFSQNNIKPRKILQQRYIRPLIDSYRDKYEFIFIDTPPCGIISDAISIAKAADGVIYVVRQDTVLQNSIRTGLGSLISADANILGCVLNGAAGGFGGYGSDYSYRGYHKYYRRPGYYGYTSRKK